MAGDYFGPLDSLINAHAATDAFLAWTGAEDAAEAEANHLFLDERDTPETAPTRYVDFSWINHEQEAYEVVTGIDKYRRDLVIGAYYCQMGDEDKVARQAFDESITAVHRELKGICQAYGLRLLRVVIDPNYRLKIPRGFGPGLQLFFHLHVQVT